MAINPKTVIDILKWVGKNAPFLVDTATKLRKAVSNQKSNTAQAKENNPDLKNPQTVESPDALKREIQTHVQVINSHTRILKEHRVTLEAHAGNLEEQAALIERLATENQKVQLLLRYVIWFVGVTFLMALIGLILLLVNAF